MSLRIEVHAARIPELGTSPSHGFVLCEVSALGETQLPQPYRNGENAAAEAPSTTNPNGPRAPLCLALVIDASSSMRGARFALALQAARDVIDSMHPQDRVLLVTFERTARVALGAFSPDAEGKAKAHSILERLRTGHGTNLGGGWREALDALSRLMMPGAARRILLLTDGMPSVGEVDPAALRALVASGRQRGVETSVVGLGDGIDERLCAALAQAGDGRFHYLRDESLLGNFIALEVEGARRLAAQDVVLSLALSMRVQRAEVMHRYSCRPDGRQMEVVIGSIAYEHPRAVLLQVDVEGPSMDAILGAASARGRAVTPRRSEPTRGGYALGALAPGEPLDDPSELHSERISITLAAGNGSEAARTRIAREVLILRTFAELRSAWDGDESAIRRRLGRARELKRVLQQAGLLDKSAIEAVPDVDAVQAALLGDPAQAREVRRSLTSMEHSMLTSQIFYVPPGSANIEKK